MCITTRSVSGCFDAAYDEKALIICPFAFVSSVHTPSCLPEFDMAITEGRSKPELENLKPRTQDLARF